METCGDCGNKLHWIEIAFGTITDPVCGRCLIKRREFEEAAEREAQSQVTGTLIGLGVIDE